MSQSRYGDIACETLYVRKHVHGLKLGESEPAARGTEIHQALATYINHLVRTRRTTDMQVFDSLTGTVGAEAREVLEKVRDPRITRESLDELRRSGDLQAMLQNRFKGRRPLLKN